MADTGQRIGSERERAARGAEGAGGPGRAVYVAPRLEPLGEWKALTLQQSVPIHGYDLLLGADPNRRLA